MGNIPLFMTVTILLLLSIGCASANKLPPFPAPTGLSVSVVYTVVVPLEDSNEK